MIQSEEVSEPLGGARRSLVSFLGLRADLPAMRSR